jgi:Rrf2 family protein
MRLSRRSEYGLRALVDLVRHAGDEPIALAVLAQRNQLPAKFLEQIMSTLKHGGIVRTTLGARGGYAIAADPTEVTVGRVIRLLDGALAPLGCVSLRYYEPCSCTDEATCPLRDVMLDVRDARDPRPRDAGRPRRATGPCGDRPARPPCRGAGGASTVDPAQSRSRLRSAALTRSSSVDSTPTSASAARDASRASASE